MGLGVSEGAEPTSPPDGNETPPPSEATNATTTAVKPLVIDVSLYSLHNAPIGTYN